jgi:hypothetical protein
MFGFTVRHGSFKPSLSRAEDIKRWQVPDTKQKMESFLGAVNYFRASMRDFAKHEARLRQFCKD